MQLFIQIFYEPNAKDDQYAVSSDLIDRRIRILHRDHQHPRRRSSGEYTSRQACLFQT